MASDRRGLSSAQRASVAADDALFANPLLDDDTKRRLSVWYTDPKTNVDIFRNDEREPARERALKVGTMFRQMADLSKTRTNTLISQASLTATKNTTGGLT